MYILLNLELIKFCNAPVLAFCKKTSLKKLFGGKFKEEGEKKMFPGMKGLDPKSMQRMMKQMGIKNEEMEAERVVIEGKTKKIVIENPSVTIVEVQGRKTYTIMGEEREEEKGISREDIDMVVRQANVSEKKAEAALKKNEGDIAAAILELKGEE
jgi:nascent polypeptide-associated complex subunit alpha